LGGGEAMADILEELKRLKKAKFIKVHRKIILMSEILNKAILNKLKMAKFEIR